MKLLITNATKGVGFNIVSKFANQNIPLTFTCDSFKKISFIENLYSHRNVEGFHLNTNCNSSINDFLFFLHNEKIKPNIIIHNENNPQNNCYKKITNFLIPSMNNGGHIIFVSPPLHFKSISSQNILQTKYMHSLKSLENENIFTNSVWSKNKNPNYNLMSECIYEIILNPYINVNINNNSVIDSDFLTDRNIDINNF